MSTKAIREALEFWATAVPTAPAGVKAKAALVELDAIENAAATVAECCEPCEPYRRSANVQSAMRLMGTIRQERR